MLAGIGLYWLGALDQRSSAVTALAAATLFGVGKTFLWPTMIGVTAELFPRGGALLLSLMGGAGMLSVGLVLPVMGRRDGSVRARCRAAAGRRARRDHDGDSQRRVDVLQIAGRLSCGAHLSAGARDAGTRSCDHCFPHGAAAGPRSAGAAHRPHRSEPVIAPGARTAASAT